MRKLVSILQKFDQSLDRACTWALIVSLGAMIILTLCNILLRWFGSTILWIEPMTRQLVFLSAFLGGTLATGSKSHIAIDLASRLLDGLGLQKLKRSLDRLILLFCLVAVLWLCHASYLLYLVEVEFGKVEFLGIHSSVLIGIVPVGLALIGYRFFYQFIASFLAKPSVR